MEMDRNKIYTELCERIGNDKYTSIIFDFLANKELIKEFVDYLESKEKDLRLFRIDKDDIPEEVEAENLEEVKNVIMDNISILDLKDLEEKEEHKFSIIIEAEDEAKAEEKLSEMDSEQIKENLNYDFN